MKMRLFCAVAVLFAFAGVGHAAEANKSGDASDSGSTRLTIPSVEVGGGSLGVSTDKPSDLNVPRFNDPANQSDRVEPFVGLKFTAPLDGK